MAFLEAKGLDKTLTSEHREQLSAYLQNENVSLGILTNGREYEFYYRYLGDSDSQFKVEAVERTTLRKLPDKKGIIEAYQVSTIHNEESIAIIEHIRKLRESRNTLTDDKKELATAVVDLLTDTVSDAIESEAQTQAKETVTCGDQNCECMDGGEKHGPYIYKYIYEDGTLRSEYLGKPANVDIDV